MTKDKSRAQKNLKDKLEEGAKMLLEDEEINSTSLPQGGVIGVMQEPDESEEESETCGQRSVTEGLRQRGEIKRKIIPQTKDKTEISAECATHTSAIEKPSDRPLIKKIKKKSIITQDVQAKIQQSVNNDAETKDSEKPETEDVKMVKTDKISEETKTAKDKKINRKISRTSAIKITDKESIIAEEMFQTKRIQKRDSEDVNVKDVKPEDRLSEQTQQEENMSYATKSEKSLRDINNNQSKVLRVNKLMKEERASKQKSDELPVRKIDSQTSTDKNVIKEHTDAYINVKGESPETKLSDKKQEVTIKGKKENVSKATPRGGEGKNCEKPEMETFAEEPSRREKQSINVSSTSECEEFENVFHQIDESGNTIITELSKVKEEEKHKTAEVYSFKAKKIVKKAKVQKTRATIPIQEFADTELLDYEFPQKVTKTVDGVRVSVQKSDEVYGHKAQTSTEEQQIDGNTGDIKRFHSEKFKEKSQRDKQSQQYEQTVKEESEFESVLSAFAELQPESVRCTVVTLKDELVQISLIEGKTEVKPNAEDKTVMTTKRKHSQKETHSPSTRKKIELEVATLKEEEPQTDEYRTEEAVARHDNVHSRQTEKLTERKLNKLDKHTHAADKIVTVHEHAKEEVVKLVSPKIAQPETPQKRTREDLKHEAEHLSSDQVKDKYVNLRQREKPSDLEPSERDSPDRTEKHSVTPLMKKIDTKSISEEVKTQKSVRDDAETKDIEKPFSVKTNRTEEKICKDKKTKDTQIERKPLCTSAIKLTGKESIIVEEEMFLTKKIQKPDVDVKDAKQEEKMSDIAKSEKSLSETLEDINHVEFNQSNVHRLHEEPKQEVQESVVKKEILEKMGKAWNKDAPGNSCRECQIFPESTKENLQNLAKMETIVQETFEDTKETKHGRVEEKTKTKLAQEDSKTVALVRELIVKDEEVKYDKMQLKKLDKGQSPTEDKCDIIQSEKFTAKYDFLRVSPVIKRAQTHEILKAEDKTDKDVIVLQDKTSKERTVEEVQSVVVTIKDKYDHVTPFDAAEMKQERTKGRILVAPPLDIVSTEQMEEDTPENYKRVKSKLVVVHDATDQVKEKITKTQELIERKTSVIPETKPMILEYKKTDRTTTDRRKVLLEEKGDIIQSKRFTVKDKFHRVSPETKYVQTETKASKVPVMDNEKPETGDTFLDSRHEEQTRKDVYQSGEQMIKSLLSHNTKTGEIIGYAEKQSLCKADKADVIAADEFQSKIVTINDKTANVQPVERTKTTVENMECKATETKFVRDKKVTKEEMNAKMFAEIEENVKAKMSKQSQEQTDFNLAKSNYTTKDKEEFMVTICEKQETQTNSSTENAIPKMIEALIDKQQKDGKTEIKSEEIGTKANTISHHEKPERKTLITHVKQHPEQDARSVISDEITLESVFTNVAETQTKREHKVDQMETEEIPAKVVEFKDKTDDDEAKMERKTLISEVSPQDVKIKTEKTKVENISEGRILKKIETLTNGGQKKDKTEESKAKLSQVKDQTDVISHIDGKITEAEKFVMSSPQQHVKNVPIIVKPKDEIMSEDTSRKAVNVRANVVEFKGQTTLTKEKAKVVKVKDKSDRISHSDERSELIEGKTFAPPLIASPEEHRKIFITMSENAIPKGNKTEAKPEKLQENVVEFKDKTDMICHSDKTIMKAECSQVVGDITDVKDEIMKDTIPKTGQARKEQEADQTEEIHAKTVDFSDKAGIKTKEGQTEIKTLIIPTKRREEEIVDNIPQTRSAKISEKQKPAIEFTPQTKVGSNNVPAVLEPSVTDKSKRKSPEDKSDISRVYPEYEETSSRKKPESGVKVSWMEAVVKFVAPRKTETVIRKEEAEASRVLSLEADWMENVQTFPRGTQGKMCSVTECFLHPSTKKSISGFLSHPFVFGHKRHLHTVQSDAFFSFSHYCLI